MNFLAIDYGTKNIGLATNNDTEIAFPLKTISNNEAVIDEIKDICDEEFIDKIVLGMPTKMNRTKGVLAEKITVFKNALEEAGLEVYLEDEIFSSEQTKKMMEDYKGKYEKDAIEAAVILQTYLEKNF